MWAATRPQTTAFRPHVFPSCPDYTGRHVHQECASKTYLWPSCILNWVYLHFFKEEDQMCKHLTNLSNLYIRWFSKFETSPASALWSCNLLWTSFTVFVFDYFGRFVSWLCDMTYSSLKVGKASQTTKPVRTRCVGLCYNLKYEWLLYFFPSVWTVCLIILWHKIIPSLLSQNSRRQYTVHKGETLDSE